MTTMTEQVASYIYDQSVPYGTYNVFACYESLEDYDNRNVDYYDIYDKSGLCVNEGEPFYEFPSWQQIYDFYYLPSIREATKDHPRDLKRATQ
jgi:hypothetical protein